MDKRVSGENWASRAAEVCGASPSQGTQLALQVLASPCPCPRRAPLASTTGTTTGRAGLGNEFHCHLKKTELPLSSGCLGSAGGRDTGACPCSHSVKLFRVKLKWDVKLTPKAEPGSKALPSRGPGVSLEAAECFKILGCFLGYI